MSAHLSTIPYNTARTSVHYSAHSGMVGDWLLTFPKEANSLPGRLATTPWRLAEQGAGWQLWRSSPAKNWRGAPLLMVETSEWSAWLTGELYGTPQPAQAVADVLEGHATANALNGHFLLLAHSRPAGEWHVWTNRHATLHAYLATDGARTAVGTYMPAVAAATGATALDWEGLTSFFGFGFFAADRTHLKGVRILRPATHYCFDENGRLQGEERYWRWRHAPDAARAYDETLEEFAGLFAAVMGDLTAGGRIAVPISGGLDSRSTVARFAPDSSASARPWAYSYGYGDDSIETQIAGQVAAARGLPFDKFTIRPYLFDRLALVAAAVEGFQDVTQARQAAVVDAIDEHSDFLIAAHWGDVYLDDVGVAHSPTGDDPAATAVDKFRKPGSDWLLDHLCRPCLSRDANTESLLRGLMVMEVDRIGPLDDPDFLIKALKTEQWSARWTTASLRMFQAAAFPRLPFYDTRLVDFFLTIPTAFVAGRRLQRDYLKRYAPDLARIPWQATGRDLFHDRGDSPADVLRRAARKGRRLLTGRRIIERNWEVQFLGRRGREGLSHWLTRPGLALHEFVAPRAVEKLLGAFSRDPWAEKRGYTVAMLLTFSAWLERRNGGSAA